jgi:hypothetical protein
VRLRDLSDRPNPLICLSSPIFKKFPFPPDPNQLYKSRRPVRHEGRIVIVTDAGRDAVDAAAEAEGRLWALRSVHRGGRPRRGRSDDPVDQHDRRGAPSHARRAAHQARTAHVRAPEMGAARGRIDISLHASVSRYSLRCQSCPEGSIERNQHGSRASLLAILTDREAALLCVIRLGFQTHTKIESDTTNPCRISHGPPAFPITMERLHRQEA